VKEEEPDQDPRAKKGKIISIIKKKKKGCLKNF
jgi:hypothetical protein